ncbi:ROK family protein [Deinococcus radiodurans]|jgi:glucokinase (EC 2.7.1.2)|uniref:Glucokinase n=1 Tax=Deinococcus radiodurans (strain ATCC 13939 / DSM 20539 / JCM 16871 / CCUG 27074 / LMG 4051 / NBRC 15346 / NCIMB 9279 / VKM B-1422 / R1) TaxID=243230 RepID=Q9RS31_DEIRA|nr:ROK family protein [Deinococcus radiodurans]AAF11841.1 glucokinase [Deinococcus radiodurans R1 = ATCC 13939 = DSM 20539]ANC70650.1 glucokinase [Deinococcus radiodurans R1 = ATCC 13939 = DSM 20539]QEM71676.1 ROK family protein [Deinococcus radiodurans]QIP27970.1 ROK family protein [Deinococcus radiodurans]UDL01318.1 ROK family protein [Deinococcus radiodurans R1 = ATCC 13939 = DSM 20539]
MTRPVSGGAAPLSIGVDVGGTKIACGVLRGEELIERQVQPTPETGWEAVLDAVAAQVRALQAAHPGAQSIGVGVPGPLNAERTRVKFAPNIYGFTDVPLIDGLRERLHLTAAQTLVLENDAKAAALAEAHLGAARGSESSIYVTVSTGIGAGLVLHGRLWRGRHGVAGELGHVTVQPGGPVSGAGLDGALEAVASGTAIARDASYALNREVSTAEAFALAEQGHPAARRVVTQAMRHIGIALADLQKVIDPEVFVIGGGVSAVGDYFFQGVQQAADEYAGGFAPVTIRRAQLGQSAGVVGAALSALHG